MIKFRLKKYSPKIFIVNLLNVFGIKQNTLRKKNSLILVH